MKTIKTGLAGLAVFALALFVVPGAFATVAGTIARWNGNYLAFDDEFVLADVYVNNIPGAFTYGGGTLPAHPFTVQAIKFHVRTAGSGGSTNATLQVSDSVNTCNCSYACNQTTGGKRASCSTGAGTGCAFAASSVLTYSYSAVGDCGATTADITGNITVVGAWQ